MSDSNRGRVERVASEFDTYSAEYRETIAGTVPFAGETLDAATRIKALHLAGLAGRYGIDAEAAEVLDVGCGVGLAHRIYSEKFGRLTGADISLESLSIARTENPRVSYDHYEGQRLPYSEARFDVCTATCVMHHVAPVDWGNFIREMVRVLKPGGAVVIFEHNPFNPVTRIVVNRCPFDEDAILIPAKQLEAMVRSSGVPNAQRDYILSFPFHESISLAADRVLRSVPVGAQYVVSGRKPTKTG